MKMQFMLAITTILTLLTGAIAVPGKPEPTWPRADITKPADLVICHSGGQCSTTDVATQSQKGFPKGCYSFFSTKQLSISPGTGLRCTLFFDGHCDFGPKDNYPNRQRSGNRPEVVENFSYPGRGSFETDEWFWRGFWSDASLGKPPKSILCTVLGAKQEGLGT